ncbi:unnamed protein product [Cylicocyclus nassatus]|uniref:Uncharacterized protein n=1 Tax=Cylicocyclus nassatus TaxID=53992 RepID=A0AA36DRC9_CYLNA|nr:unnamed protein product [Cylicocyclus nassatus]
MRIELEEGEVMEDDDENPVWSEDNEDDNEANPNARGSYRSGDQFLSRCPLCGIHPKEYESAATSQLGMGSERSDVLSSVSTGCSHVQKTPSSRRHKKRSNFIASSDIVLGFTY